uniref:claudin-15-like isoform X3 n=1 Tax=Myxine glutinosa TaxID=7769 RepID=UPI00358E77E7
MRELIGLFLGFLSLVLSIATICSPYMRVATVVGSLITTNNFYENLWQSCAEDATGVSNCLQFDTVFAVPDYVQACRAFMFISILLKLSGSVCAALSATSSRFAHSHHGCTRGLAMSAAVMYLVGGLCCFTAISWYAYQITFEFYDPFFRGIKYEFGSALYLGWTAGTMALIGGSCFCCAYLKKKQATRRDG